MQLFKWKGCFNLTVEMVSCRFNIYFVAFARALSTLDKFFEEEFLMNQLFKIVITFQDHLPIDFRDGAPL